MTISSAVAKDDHQMEEHTWEKGHEYQVINAVDHVKIASNEGHVNISGLNNSNMDKLAEMFDFRYAN